MVFCIQIKRSVPSGVGIFGYLKEKWTFEWLFNTKSVVFNRTSFQQWPIDSAEIALLLNDLSTIFWPQLKTVPIRECHTVFLEFHYDAHLIIFLMIIQVKDFNPECCLIIWKGWALIEKVGIQKSRNLSRILPSFNNINFIQIIKML